jgi:hypothetical protein
MNRTTTIASALTLLLSAPLIVQAGQQSGQGAGNGAGPIHDLNNAVCESISGTVQEVGLNGSGYVIDTLNDGALIVFGVAPLNYFASLGLIPPQVGEPISADICWLSFSDGSEKAIATQVTLSDGTPVILRDAASGQPSWRGGFGAGQGVVQGGSQGAGQGLGLADCTGPR